MKNIIAIIAVLSSFQVFGYEFPSFSSELTEWNISKKSQLFKKEVVGARIEHFSESDQWQLTWMMPWSCPAGAACALVMPQRQIRFDIVSEDIDACGVKVTEALNQELGLELEIVDYSGIVCDHKMMVSNDLSMTLRESTGATSYFFNKVMTRALKKPSRELEVLMDASALRIQSAFSK